MGPEGPPGQTTTLGGSVPTEADLPASANLGEAYIVQDTGHIFVWVGVSAQNPTGWVDIGPAEPGAVPGPPDMSVQFNQASLFTGRSNFVFDYNNNRVGILNSGPLFPLDVGGNVNSSGCYLINGTSFACSGGGANVALSNILGISAFSGSTFTVSNGNAILELRPSGDAYLSSANSYIQVGADNNVYVYAAQTQFAGTTGGNTTVGVTGAVNITGCYQIASVDFACPDGSGGIALSNISTINGTLPQTDPAPPNMSIQWNNANDWGGSANLTWNDATSRLTVIGSSTVQGGTFAVNDSTGNWALTVTPSASAMSIINASAWMSILLGPFGPNYPLDVNGDINCRGCYRINGYAFACTDGSTGAALSNITTINGSPVVTGPAGPNQAVQWNNGGVFGGSNNLSWGDAGCVLTLNNPQMASAAYCTLNMFGKDGSGISLASNYISYIQWEYNGTRDVWIIDHVGANIFWIQTVAGSGKWISLNSVDGNIVLQAATSVMVTPQSRPNFQGAQWAFDTWGDINLYDNPVGTYSYRINGVPWASLAAGGTQIDLTNIATINGAAPGGGGTPAGPNQAVQWNSNGSFGGSGNLRWSDGVSQLILDAAGTGNALVLFTSSGSTRGYVGMLQGAYATLDCASGGFVQIASQGNLGVGSFSNSGVTPQFKLDVGGEVNSSGCYRINGIPFACISGTGNSIALDNISTINGATPGGGGSPAPPNGAVQWDNGGVFGGDPNFIFDNSATTLALGAGSVGSGDGVSPFTLDVVGQTNSYVARFTNPGLFTGVVIDHGDNSGGGDSILSFRSAGNEAAVIQYDDDEDGLIFFTGNRDADLSTLCCSTNSYVGVNTTTPMYVFDVLGQFGAAVIGRFTTSINATSNNCQVRWASVNVADDLWALGTDFYNALSKDFSVYDIAGNVGAVMTFQSGSGSVGIGTASPLDRLHVNNSSGDCMVLVSAAGSYAQYRLQTTTRAWQLSTQQSDGLLYFFDENGGGYRFAISTAGVVSAPAGLCAGQMLAGIPYSYPFFVHTGPDANLAIGPAVQITGACCIQTANDAWTVNTAMEFRATQFAFEVGYVCIGSTVFPSPLTCVGPAGPGQIRISTGSQYGVLFYTDDNNYYFLFTNQNDPWGGFNSLRPFYINLANGSLISTNSQSFSGGFHSDTIRFGNILASDWAYVEQAGDIGTARASNAGTGVCYFGNGGHNIYWDGGTFNFSSSINAAGNITGGRIFANDWYIINAGGIQFSNGTQQTTAFTGSAGISGIFGFAGFPASPAGPYAGANYDGIAVVMGPSINTSGGNGVYGGHNCFICTIGYTSSDIRLKQNVTPLEGGIEVIKQIRPIKGEWNGLGGKPKGHRLISLHAEELQEIMPEAVYPWKMKLNPEDEEETETLSYDPTPVLMQAILAIQQLSKRLEALEAK